MFLAMPLGALFAKTAMPIVLIMFTNGLFTVVDGWFVGRFVGEEAFSAVTMVFPLFMMLIALGTLVSSGFSSVLSRYIGAGNRALAEESLVSALALSAVICVLLMVLYAVFGQELIAVIANGSISLAHMGNEYLSVVIYFSALFFILSMTSDGFRCQGKFGAMTIITLLATFLNILFTYILIAVFEMGVAGSAYGTALAQGGSVLAALMYQYSDEDCLRFRLRRLSGIWHNWGNYLALGAPTSLSYVGISILSATIIFQLQVWDSHSYEISVAAYGIVTRVMTFAYMPLLALTLAQQAIVGNNYGAKNWDRTAASLKISMLIAIVYCILLQVIFFVAPTSIAGIFVDNPSIVIETKRIFLPMTTLYFLFGPLLMIPGFFQAIGDAKLAAILGLTKIYFISVPMLLILPLVIGETGIWYSGPVSEFLALFLTLGVLYLLDLPKQGMAGYLKARA